MDTKKKTAAIVTFHEAANYGAVLQAYALCRALSHDCQAVIYPHHNQHISDLYNPNPFKARSLSKLARKLLYFPATLKKRKAFDRFLYNHLPMGDKNKDYDLFIAGSDQVWNHAATRFDKAYFLDFVKEKGKKKAYAASFGFDQVPDEHKETYRQLLKEFDQIAVREESGKAIVRDLLGHDVPVVLDPSLLLTGEEWQKAFPEKQVKKPYVLVYAFGLSNSMCKAINAACEALDARAVVLMPMKSISPKRNKRLKRAEYHSAVTPEAWVQYFAQADYVITNSFHGLSFSLNFQKPFMLETLKPPAKVNTRLINMLEKIGLTGRILDNNAEELLAATIDYKPVQAVLERERAASLAFLKSMVG